MASIKSFLSVISDKIPKFVICLPVAQWLISPWPRQKHGVTNRMDKCAKTLNGTVLLCLENWPKWPGNICVKVLRSISKVSYVAASGLINLVWRSTLQKLWLTLGAPCRCWAAAVKVSLNLIRKRHLLPPPVQRKGKVRLQVKNLTLLRSNHLRSLIRVTILTMRSPFDDAEKPLMQGLLQEKNHDRQHEHIT
ncbi:single-stranded DNA-binding protein [Klebsiella pneumoniae Kb140]|nr:single-stranded DNA-binding protein [Klebsiella pneumoniae Kb140]